jgi:ubiquinone/menaquinone biosynthesis C-methylase UbiE
MTASNALNADDRAGAPERYVYEAEDAFTLKYHASRTADRQAAFFLPFLSPGMRLLDCGFGSGSITVGLARYIDPGQVTGVDISAAEVARARARAATEGIGNVHFEVGNIYDLAFPAQSFDAIFAHNVLEHVSRPHKVLVELGRVLKPGGVIGIRDCDMGGTIFHAKNDLVLQYIGMHEATWQNAGGDPWMARRLRGLLHEAGFVDLSASASFELYCDQEGLQLLSQTIVSRLADPNFVQQVVSLGLADSPRIAAIQAAWQAWPTDPAAFGAVAHCEVVGRKA